MKICTSCCCNFDIPLIDVLDEQTTLLSTSIKKIDFKRRILIKENAPGLSTLLSALEETNIFTALFNFTVALRYEVLQVMSRFFRDTQATLT